MAYRLLADLVVVLHFAFILFVILGGLAVLRWRRVAWAHVPVFAYGALIEFFGWTCPLTPFEKFLRVRGGGVSYDTNFTDHYIMPLIYPSGLTPGLQIVLGVLVLVVNGALYTWAWQRSRIAQ